MTFDPAKLHEARTKRKFSLEKLADAAGVTAQTISNWENGRGEPDASKLGAIAVLTSCPLDFFYRSVA